LLQYNVADWLCHIPTDRQEAQKQINGKAENADYGSRKRQAHDYPGGEANMNQKEKQFLVLVIAKLRHAAVTKPSEEPCQM
jgi:hypothetical protein